ncbi:phytoene/squalene synthetase-like protein [alpha proteobacterium U9-1i]|nr:phytoene/squalene synthetase-like protein [alpha proteobacterium U9-1i]
MEEGDDALLRRVDEDRWLASRFAPPEIRRRLIAIYALNYEIARTAEVVREPAVGVIRLAWWRDALANVHAGKQSGDHRSLRSYASVAAGLPGTCWDDLIEARALDFEQTPFANWAAAERYVDATAGAVMRLAVAACSRSADEAKVAAPFVRVAAWAWGYLGLARAAPIWTARGRNLLPEADMRVRARAAYSEARTLARDLPAHLFPAFGYVALVPAYLRANAPALFTCQLRLVWASATGRL